MAKLLTENLVPLTETLSHITPILNRLQGRKYPIITLHDIEVINSKPTSLEQNTALVHLMMKKSDEDIFSFLDILRSVGYQDLVNKVLNSADNRDLEGQSTTNNNNIASSHPVEKQFIEMAQLFGVKIERMTTMSSVVVSWKQGSFLGIGGDRSHEYKVFIYTLSNSSGSNILVFVQDNMDIPDSLNIDRRFQFGCQNGNLFLVLHDKSRRPYQNRFFENKNLAAQYGNSLSKNWTSTYDLSWVVGDYLRDF